MRNFALLILAAFLVFGCAGQQPAGNATTNDSFLPLGGPAVEPSEECQSEYSFSEIEKGTFGKNTKLVATVTCAAGKNLAVTIDDEVVESTTVDSNATVPVEFSVPGIKDGTVKLAVESDGESVYSRDWEVESLGNADTFGTGYDPFSYKEYVAMAFDIESSVDVGQIKIYMKRQNPNIRESSKVVLEVREDSNGEPGSLVTSKKESIETTTLSENWIRFDFEDKISLSPGTYWVVLKVEQSEDLELTTDIVTVHYAVLDRDKEGNDYTRKMKLDVDLKTGDATETTWTPFSYDREHNIVLSYGK